MTNTPLRYYLFVVSSFKHNLGEPIPGVSLNLRISDTHEARYGSIATPTSSTSGLHHTQDHYHSFVHAIEHVDAQKVSI